MEAIIHRARTVVLAALQEGWKGPPYDPASLADLLGIKVSPSHEILDARTVPLPGRRFEIEFNPSRPKGRVRYSIAHEIAHTLFPDCADTVRHRHAEAGKDWELELLCNIGAAELLMPIGSFSELSKAALSVDTLLELRKQYDVSFEALFLRFIKTTLQPVVLVSLSRKESGQEPDPYQADYLVPSRGFSSKLPEGGHVVAPLDSVATQCTAIGATSKGTEAWLGFKARTECVGIPPFPGRVYPRVLAIAVPKGAREPDANGIVYLRGDATEPRGGGEQIIAQVVNDKAATWGAGFAKVIAKKWPVVQAEFRVWAEASSSHLRLGQTHMAVAPNGCRVFQMVAQHGYGPATKPRVRYTALRDCLLELARVALDLEAMVHMPRIGCGEAGGDWNVVSELVDDCLCRSGIPVHVYDLPNRDFVGRAPQHSFAFGSST